MKTAHRLTTDRGPRRLDGNPLPVHPCTAQTVMNRGRLFMFIRRHGWRLKPLAIALGMLAFASCWWFTIGLVMAGW